MARDDHTMAANAQMTQQVVYGIDPRGAGMFAALNAVRSRDLTGQRAVVTRPMFGGWAAAPQAFRGAAALGTSRPVARKSSEMSDQVSQTMADPIKAAFLAREQS